MGSKMQEREEKGNALKWKEIKGKKKQMMSGERKGI